MNTPINSGLLQSDLDCAGFAFLNANIPLPPPLPSPLVTVNVTESPYNAVGDGVTDDTTAIQAAINYVGSVGGGTVFFPKGVYLCNGAFDATTNSILKFPYVPIQTGGNYNNPVTIELLGETPAAIGSASTLATNSSIIRSTKTGTGINPSILAAYTVIGRAMPAGFLTTFSYVQPVIRNLQFQTDVNPTIHGIRLDSAVMAILEDVVITSDGGETPPEPTNSTVGLWMPATLNFATSHCNRVWIAGFDTGLVASCEHFRGPQVNFADCHIACEFLSGGELAWGNFMVFRCNTALKFTSINVTADRCPVILNVQNEIVTSDWRNPAPGGDILDSSNTGAGEIRYFKWTPTGHGVASVTGCGNLKLIDTNNIWNTYTIASLPSSPSPGQMANITDGTAALAWGATVTGGGGGDNTKYLVWYNGTNWTVYGK